MSQETEETATRHTIESVMVGLGATRRVLNDDGSTDYFSKMKRIGRIKTDGDMEVFGL